MNKYLWIYFSFFATFITATAVIFMKYLTDSKCHIRTLTFLTFIITSFMVLIYIPFDTTVINDIKKNIQFKDYLLLILFSFVMIANRLIQLYVFKITPNIGITNLIINANVIVSLLASYLLFKQFINYKSLIGIFIAMFGLSITIYYSNN